MNRFKPAIIFWLILLIAIAIFSFGVWVALDATHRLNRTELKTGIIILLFGPIVVSVFLVGAINRFIPSERERLRDSAKRNRPSSVKYRIKKAEQTLRRLNYIKRNPLAAFFFILCALIVSAGMTFAPYWNPHSPSALGCQVLGVVIGFGYSVMLFLFIRLLALKKWEAYVDTSIASLEERLNSAKAESEASAPPTKPATPP